MKYKYFWLGEVITVVQAVNTALLKCCSPLFPLCCFPQQLIFCNKLPLVTAKCYRQGCALNSISAFPNWCLPGVLDYSNNHCSWLQALNGNGSGGNGNCNSKQLEGHQIETVRSNIIATAYARIPVS